MLKQSDKAAEKSGLIRRARQAIRVFAIIAVSAAAGIGVSWRAPGLELYARDWLMRLRGPVAPPDEVVIIAIDEASQERFGRFPWPRNLMARALDALRAAGPKAVALDVLYTEPTAAEEDRALAEAIARAGNVVVAAQLIEITNAEGSLRAEWLRPLAEIERAAAGVGHVNIFTGYDGVARSLSLRQADWEGQALWAMAVETVRVGDGVKVADLRESPDAAMAGARRIPFNADPSPVVLQAEVPGSRYEAVSASRLLLDYAGPAGSFATNLYGFGDLLDGRAPVEKLRGKYVLVGATATALGDRVASPFTRVESDDGRPRAQLTPGVEVLANALHTILRQRFYRETPDWAAASCGALVAAAVLLSLALAQGRFETLKQLGVLLGLASLIVLAAYLAFVHLLIAPPLVPALGALVVAAPLALLRRSLALSSDLDARIAELTRGGVNLTLAGVNLTPAAGVLLAQARWPDPAATIARWTGADAVAIFARQNGKAGRYRLVAQHGAPARAAIGAREALDDGASLRPVAQALVEPAERYFSFPASKNGAASAFVIRLNEAAPGTLIIARSGAQPPANETLLLCRETAASFLASVARDEWLSAAGASRWWPRGGEWKARALGLLNRRLLSRSRFIERALRAVEDGLVVTSADGSVVFANPRAAAILGLPERALAGSSLFERIREAERGAGGANDRFGDDRFGERAAQEILFHLIVERAAVEREITISPDFGNAPTRHYALRLSAVSEQESGAALGLVASFSDITRQRELQQTKNDVMALVSHELRTPLTAIQAMSEVLAKHDLSAERRREMHAAINDETKRLARMIDEYLDITRLESGARPLQLVPVRVASLLERTLMLLDPVAEQRGMRIVRRLAPQLPMLVADGDLIARAVTNLVANAIKFSPPHGEVIVTARVEGDALWIEVGDQGCGIPAESLPRVFDKFYRAPHVGEFDDDAPGAGLGLAFVREIAEMHGGRVTVESEVGVGSVFTLRLPLAAKEK